MKPEQVSGHVLKNRKRVFLLGAFIFALAAVSMPFHSARSGSAPAGSKANQKVNEKISLIAPTGNSLSTVGAFLPQPQSSPETIETFASDCMTPKTTFLLGETVCAKTTFVTETDRFVNWVSPPDSQVAHGGQGVTDITTNLPQDFLYMPTVAGTWKVTIADPLDSSIIPTEFEVVAQGPLVPYAAGCTAPQAVFNLGTDICVKVTGGLVAPRRISFVDPSGYVRQIAPVSTDPENHTYPIPGDPTSTLANGLEVINLGTWRVNLLSSRGSSVAFITFVVKDPGNARAEIAVSKRAPMIGEGIPAGSTATFSILVTNGGPDAAQNVVVTDVVPDDTTFVSIAPSAGCTTPGLGGTGTITCNIASLARGASVTYDVSFTVSPSAVAGAVIANTATVDSPTGEEYTGDNSSTATITVTDPGTPGCTLTCPGNITVESNTTQAGEPGAFVDFSAASGSGNCGAISNNPSSRQPDGTYAFLALGTHLITSTATATGDTCTFTVTVVDTPPPTIGCPEDQTVAAASGQSSANVSVGAPTTNPTTGVTVIGIRSDDPNCTDTEVDPGCTPVSLSAPYPVGTTTITWTVIQSNGQRASCVQRITVLENNCEGDITPPTLTAPLGWPSTISVGTGPDSATAKFCAVALDDELAQGELVIEDDCSASLSVTGVPANNAFPIGTTTVTYRAIDGSGNMSSPVVQQVTVFDNTPPIVVAPPDASYTCLSEVPAGGAAIALARGDDPNLLNGGPPTDNCGAPVITYSDSSTGAGSVSSPRIITRTYTATDGAGNTASDSQTITVTDGTAPTISCPADIVVYLPLNSTAVSMPVNFTVNGNDNCAGVSVASTPASGSTFSVGTTTVNSTATDWAGNTASCSFNVTVLYNFTGFFQPVNNLPTLNVVNAGRGIPVKFSLSGDKGLNIFAANSPYTVSINCDGSAPQTDVEETLTAGGSSLSYSPDTYNYVWKTESSWAGTCRQLVVTLNDGSEHRANFKFR